METHKKDGKSDKAADQNMLQNLQLLALASLQPGTPVSAGQMYEPSILAAATGGMWPQQPGRSAMDIQQQLLAMHSPASNFPLGIASAANSNAASLTGFPTLGTLSGFPHGLFPVGSNEWIAMQQTLLSQMGASAVNPNFFYPLRGNANSTPTSQANSHHRSNRNIKDSYTSPSNLTNHYDDPLTTPSGKNSHPATSNASRKSSQSEISVSSGASQQMSQGINQMEILQNNLQMHPEKLNEFFRQMEQHFLLQKLHHEQQNSIKTKTAGQQQQEIIQQQLLNASAAAAAVGIPPAAFLAGSAALDPLLANVQPFSPWSFPDPKTEQTLIGSNNNCRTSAHQNSSHLKSHHQHQRNSKSNLGCSTSQHFSQKVSSRTSNGDQHHRTSINSHSPVTGASESGIRKRHEDASEITEARVKSQLFDKECLKHSDGFSEPIKSTISHKLTNLSLSSSKHLISTSSKPTFSSNSRSGNTSHSTGTFHPPTWVPSPSQLSPTSPSLDTTNKSAHSSGRRRKQAAPTSLSGNVVKSSSPVDSTSPPSKHLKRESYDVTSTNESMSKTQCSKKAQSDLLANKIAVDLSEEGAKIFFALQSMVQSALPNQQNGQQSSQIEDSFVLNKFFKTAYDKCNKNSQHDTSSAHSVNTEMKRDYLKWNNNQERINTKPEWNNKDSHNLQSSNDNDFFQMIKESMERDFLQKSSSSMKKSKESPELSAKLTDSICFKTTGENKTEVATENEKQNVISPVSSESKLLEPINHGWSREIHIDEKIEEGAQGYVIYLTPEKIKLKNMQDINRYLQKKQSKALFDQNCFSFDTELPIGSLHFADRVIPWESLKELTNPKTDFTKLTDLNQLSDSSSEQQLNNISTTVSSRHMNNSSKSMSATSCSSSNLQLVNLINDNKDEVIKVEKNDQQDQLKMQKENKLNSINKQKYDQQLYKEIRDRQIIEERRRAEILRQQKHQEAIKRAKEKEDRKQQLLTLKALENKRKAEERDRRREQMKSDRLQQREKKLEQKRIAMKIAQKNKMTFEDRLLKDQSSLPVLDTFQGTIEGDNSKTKYVELSGTATADVCMVLEFVHTFNEAITLDKTSIPTFEELRLGLLNDSRHVDALARLTIALLHQCLCDPGVPVPGPWLNCGMGLKVTDIDISTINYSEILRLFIWARNGYKTEISKQLETRPFSSLDADRKTQVLAFLTNELISSRSIVTEIERHLEALATLRRDKWMVEGRIRQARLEAASELNELCNSPSKVKKKLNDETNDTNQSSETTVPEPSKSLSRHSPATKLKLENLSKEHQSFTSKLFLRSKPLRALDCGQDRFKRRYWVLSNLGSVYVEGLESGVLLNDEDDVKDLLSEDEEIANDKQNNEGDVDSSAKYLLNGGDSNNQEKGETGSERIKDGDSVMLYDKASFSHKVSILKEEMNDVKQRSALVYDPLRKNDQFIKHENKLVSHPPNESAERSSNGIVTSSIKSTDNETSLSVVSQSELPIEQSESIICHTSTLSKPTSKLNDVTIWKKEKGSDDVDQDAPMDLTTSSSSEIKQESDSIKSFSKTNDHPSLPDSSCDVINIRDSRTPESSGTSAETIQLSTGRIFSQMDLSQTEESELLDHPTKIPREMKYGWWKIEEEEHLEKLINSLHPRGSREKELHRLLTKHKKHIVATMEVAKQPEFRISKRKVKKKSSMSDNGSSGKTKQQAEAKDNEEKKKKKKKGRSSDVRFSVEDNEDESSDNFEKLDQTTFNSELQVLKQVEELLDRCVAVNILNKAWSSIPKASVARTDLKLTSHLDAIKRETAPTSQMIHDDCSILGEAVHLIQKLEQAIPRPFLKPPLIRKGGATEFSNLPSLSESGAGDVAAGLRTWRNGVGSASSAAQLSMAVTMLETCIAWEKFTDTNPPTRQREQGQKLKKKRSTEKKTNSHQHQSKKRKKNNTSVTEDLLASSTASPANRMPIENADVTNRKSTTFKKTVLNEDQDKNKKPENNCDQNRNNNFKKNSDVNGNIISTIENDIHLKVENNKVIEFKTTPTTKPKKKRKVKPIPTDVNQTPKPRKKRTHTSVCRDVLKDLQAHSQSAFFLYPVNVKEIPDYKKIIKKPIDFQTIEKRLRKGRYKSRHSFSAEVRMVFDNCQAYNVDDSPIGRAGHTLRKYFEERWNEVEMREEEEEKRKAVEGNEDLEKNELINETPTR